MFDPSIHECRSQRNPLVLLTQHVQCEDVCLVLAFGLIVVRGSVNLGSLQSIMIFSTACDVININLANIIIYFVQRPDGRCERTIEAPSDQRLLRSLLKRKPHQPLFQLFPFLVLLLQSTSYRSLFLFSIH